MDSRMMRAALSLCLAASLATPVWATEAGPGKIPSVLLPAAAAADVNQVPTAVTVDGKSVKFDKGPVMVAGVLMVPVRAIAEAAGGTVTWDPAVKLIHVRMPERMIQMKQPPTLVAGRTLISADALSGIFGFQVQTGTDSAIVLTSPVKAAPGAGQQAERGTITQVEAGEHPRVLLAGDRMANSEQRLTWASITSSTRITVREAAQTRAGAVADLQVGPQVEITWAGPLMLSYPAQGTAAEIVIHK
ncbi:MAG: hypothetical protein JWN15_2665 [Firmicutes bacterium]|nr:hypothetical protein [Bacillota bacterium]